MERGDLLTIVTSFCLIIAMLLAASYGAYIYGVKRERRALYSALFSQLEAAYGDGFHDGIGRGRTKGWADAMSEVDNETLFSGHY